MTDAYDGLSLVRSKRGLWLREGDTGDRDVTGEISSYSKLPVLPGDVVLDIGAHIGAFTTLVAIPRGASLVVAIEPDAENFAVLKRNVAPFQQSVEAYRGAVVHGHEPTVTLQLCANKSSMHTLVPTRGREGVKVQAICFSELLKFWRPSVVKMDIEGGEYSLMDELMLLPDYVEALAIEIHPYKGDRSRVLSRRLVKLLAQQFTALKAAKITEKNWVTVGIYARGKRTTPWQVRELLETRGCPPFWERRLSAWEAQYTAQPKE